MKLVIVESPYAGEVELNVAYARWALGDCLRRGAESPIASHLLYTQPGVLNDLIPEERALGIAAGLAWRRAADLSVFYLGRGWSNGMRAAVESARREGRPYELRDVPPTVSADMTGSTDGA